MRAVWKKLTPISKAAAMTLGSDAALPPKPRRLTFSPVLPSVPWAILSGRGAGGGPPGRVWLAEAATGSASPDTRKARREDHLAIIEILISESWTWSEYSPVRLHYTISPGAMGVRLG